MVVNIPSPARLRRGKMMCPDCSPPNVEPVRRSSSSTYLSPTSVRRSSIPRARIKAPRQRPERGIAAHEPPPPVHEERAVGVAVVGDAEVRVLLDDAGTQ